MVIPRALLLKTLQHRAQRLVGTAASLLRVAAKGKSPSSSRWLQRQMKDPLVLQASLDLYRSRAAYKLIEIDDKYHFLRPGVFVIDLGASPGSWSQVCTQRIRTCDISREELESGVQGMVVSIDIQAMSEIPGVVVLPAGDITEEKTQSLIVAFLKGRGADVVLSDMAPNACGISGLDHQRIMELGEGAFALAKKVLKPNGVFVCKLWHGSRVNGFKSTLKSVFGRVEEVRPRATRKESSEMYLYASGFGVQSKPDISAV
ncbi:hypothetical protein EMCRGX_G032504 [Ephydatia muelleri]